ncbi:uncharacterized protein LOC131956464 [Physella acuta]|uniref:uncharacterized protein LOC131956464 n=1 Tax=Physella acuta TaxID=109671 RepID=UPI0027DD86A9|nr:uncharacterized protein LOC131956464 [Physella acuta]
MATQAETDSDEIKRGHHETEVCYAGEADLDKHEAKCEKHPGHEEFIPAGEFKYENLPERYRDPTVLNIVKSLAALTVKVKVTYVSTERPKRASFYTGDYPFYQERGTSLIRYGTGRIEDVYFNFGPTVKMKHPESCPCELCIQNGEPLKECGVIIVVTSMQLVFDGEEATNTQVFLEWEDNTTLTFVGSYMNSRRKDGDRVEMACVTYDLEFAKKLKDMTRAFFQDHRSIKMKYHRNNLAREENVVFIVSFPHGKSKKVSIGYVIKEISWKYTVRYTKYSYTAPTCPGSSGAPVFVMGYNGCYVHTHAGRNKVENFSGE